MIKIICLLFLMQLISNSVLAQATVNQKIVEIYGEAFIDNNPTLVQSFRKLLEERIRYIEEPESENEKFPKISSLGLKNKNNTHVSIDTQFDELTFNPLKYGIQMFAPNTQVYRIDNTDFLIIIEPQNN